MKKWIIVLFFFVVLSSCSILDEIQDFNTSPNENRTITNEHTGIKEDTEITKPNVNVPVTPLLVNRYFPSDTLRTQTLITDISYTVDSSISSNFNIRVSFSGEKIFDLFGDDNSSMIVIEVRLLDGDGYVVSSKSLFTPSIRVGDKFRDLEVLFMNIRLDNYIIEIKPNQ